MKHEKPYVRVFLRHKDEKAEKFFKEHCSVSEDTVIEFINVAEMFKNIEEERKKDTEMFAIDCDTRKKMSSTIKTEGKKLMVKYSNIVGLGIGKCQFEENEFSEPCIVLYCLDKALIPYGEQPLPIFLNEFPVDIREDFVRLGNCSNCKILNSGCSIGRPSNRSAGSVGFWVRSKNSSLIRNYGFLTAAHVAIERFSDLYDANVLLSNHPLKNTAHEIVHPSVSESKHNRVIGHVVESFCGNFGDHSFGLDIAFVNFNGKIFGGIHFISFNSSFNYYPAICRNIV